MILEIKHLAPYLPYGLKAQSVDGFGDNDYVGKNINLTPLSIEKIDGVKWKPILHPLSDYSDINSPKMIELNCDLHNQIEIYNLSNCHCGYWNCSYQSIKIMCENHIDFQGLIGKGLAIDVNILTDNQNH